MADTTWIKARIARAQTIIVAYEDAIEALAAGAQTYTFDTGQTRQSVTRAQLSQLKNMLAYQENRLATLETRLNGGGVYVRPGF